MGDNEITAIVGWPTEPQMVKYRAIADAAMKVEREACAATYKAEISRLEMERDWYRAFYLSHVSEPHGVA